MVFILPVLLIPITLSQVEMDSDREGQEHAQHPLILLLTNVEVLAEELQVTMLEVVIHFPAMAVVTVGEADISTLQNM